MWRPIAGFPEYSVSDSGRIRRGDRIKALRFDRKGYVQVVLWRNHRSYTRGVAKLVANAFLGPQPAGHVVCHINGINNDDRATNLRYDTPRGNEADKLSHGTKRIGEDHSQAKLTDQQVIEIRTRYRKSSKDNGGAALARKFGVSRVLVNFIINRKLWRHLP